MSVTKTTTILFTDIVDSTSLLSVQGDFAFDEVRRRHAEVLRREIERFGGTEVKSTGDGVMVAFEAAVGALNSAVAMQRQLELHRRADGSQPHVRIGIALGDATLENDDWFGLPVVEAARVCSHASPDQILCTELTATIARPRAEMTISPHAPIDAKGFDIPIPVQEVVWNDGLDDQIPMPSVLREQDGFSFAGRADEVATVRAAYDEASEGRPVVVDLHGEPGVGKTRLAAHVASLLHDEGATVLFGACSPDGGVPFEPFAEAVRAFADHVTDELLATRLGSGIGELTRLAPGLTQRTETRPTHTNDADIERHLLHEAMLEFLGATARARPAVVVLDDIQWAGAPTVQLLRAIAQTQQGVAALILTTRRDTEPSTCDELDPMLAELRVDGACTDVALAGLDSDAINTLTEIALEDPPEALADQLIADTNGNALYVCEMLRHLIDHPDDASTPPSTLRDLVTARTARLGGEASNVLTTAATIGQQFDLRTLVGALDLPPTDVLQHLGEALESRLVTDVHGRDVAYRFSHALMQRALYDAQDSSRRTARHARIVDALEASGAGDDATTHALARHAYEARDLVGAETAGDYAARAGRLAIEQLAYHDAIDYLTTAIELATPSMPWHDRYDLLLDLGRAKWAASDSSSSSTLADAIGLAERHGDVERVAHAVLADSRGTYTQAGVVDQAGVDRIEAALKGLPSDDSPLRARLLARLSNELTYSVDNGDRRDESGAAALAMADRLGDDRVTAEVLRLTQQALSRHSLSIGEQLERAEQLARLGVELDDPVTEFFGCMFQTVAMLDGDIGRAVAAHERAAELAGGLGQPWLVWWAATRAATFAVVHGDIDQGERLANEALALGMETGDPDAQLLYAAHLFMLRRLQGRLPELEELLSAVVAGQNQVTEVDFALALVYCESEQAAKAEPILAPMAADGFKAFDGQLMPLSLAADAVADLGHSEWAGLLLPLLEPHRGEFVGASGAVFLGSVSRSIARLRALIGDIDGALELFEEAERQHLETGARPLLALVRLQWAGVLAAQDPERARTLAAEALAEAKRLGLATVERRAMRLLDG